MYSKKFLLYTFLFGVLLVEASRLQAQSTQSSSDNPNYQVGYDSQGKPIKKKTTGNDTLQHRNPLEDSLTLTYKYYDSSNTRKLDSSISDFYKRFLVPNSYVDLGNLGNAAHSLIFRPLMKPGWDAGFHAYDIYNYTVENSKFYQTTRPYSELSYLIGSKAEQLIELQHTQNRGPDFNFAFDFRFLNSPGDMKNENTNNNNLRITTNYVSKNRRYSNYFIYINNKIRSSENGGMQTKGALDSLNSGGGLNNVFELPVKLGNNYPSQNNFLASAINTGTLYDETIMLFRQNYDVGQKDSLVQDTVTYRLFYPRLRFQHTITYKLNTYVYEDNNPTDSSYRSFYNYILANDTVYYRDKWTNVSNDFSIISFPQKNNLNQYLKLGGGIELISGNFGIYSQKYTNVYTEAEYRNRTRNKKWDLIANGQLYMAGGYAGDYSAYIGLKRQLSKKIGSLQIGFRDVNRTPSFVDDQFISSFPTTSTGTFKKENIAQLFADVSLPIANLRLYGNYYVINNYTYFNGFFSAVQDATLFNLLHVGLEKSFKLTRFINWYTSVDLQQTTPGAPVHVPLFLTRNRLAFEGNFYKNLFLSTGIEVRYYSPYKADAYSPLIGQFYVQEDQTIANRPDVNVFMNFRIKSFKAFVRIENVNTINPQDGFGFTQRNFSAPFYPSRALWFRFGVWWSFVN
jgi:hypothetical protein